jgi:uncharacterized protein (TIGR02453 family)
MNQIEKSTFRFLELLKENNNREWFHANKPLFNAARNNFTSFIDALLPEIAVFDPGINNLEGKDCVFRIYRDTRFSKDKKPYKSNLGAHILPGGRKTEHARAGYYIHIEPGGCFLAGGAYLPPGPWIKAIRQEIDYNANDLKKILDGKKFKEYFGEIEGEKLKTAPRDYPMDHPEIELLRHKSLLAVHKMDDELVLSTQFLDHCTKVFKVLQPFDDFLNRSTH